MTFQRITAHASAVGLLLVVIACGSSSGYVEQVEPILEHHAQAITTYRGAVDQSNQLLTGEERSREELLSSIQGLLLSARELDAELAAVSTDWILVSVAADAMSFHSKYAEYLEVKRTSVGMLIDVYYSITEGRTVQTSAYDGADEQGFIAAELLWEAQQLGAEFGLF